MKKTVSIVVLNWNGRDNLKTCFNSLQKLSYKPLEILLVDNNSSDDSVDYTKKHFPMVKIIRNQKNLGYAGGNNVGIRKSKGEYILILNNDTKLPSDCLEPLVTCLDTYPDVGCVQPQLLYASQPQLLNAVGSYFTDTGFLYHYGYRKPAPQEKYNKRMFIYSAKGAAMLLRRRALGKVGLFDEDFFIFFEETDLCHRLWLAGFSVVYEPRSKLYHFEAVDTSKQMDNFTRQYLSLRNRIASFIKNLETQHIFLILLPILLIYFLSFIYCMLRFRLDLSKAVIMSIWWNIIHLSQTLKKRYTVQRKIRKRSDQELYSYIKVNPPLRYYYYLFFDNLKNYADETVLTKSHFF